MNLQRIKIIAENKSIEFKALAKAIGMSEGNLHRCVRENRISAQDLEKIAAELRISVVEFFDEQVSSVHTEGDYSPASVRGNISVTNSDVVLSERIKSLESLIKEKDERIMELKERIMELKAK
ncbi:MAG: helix-turn-helix domain-containing protein [Bacteroidales bacterium]|nr:helix-turn-helix domain-containing protein [Bacteroidales bacterium]